MKRTHFYIVSALATFGIILIAAMSVAVGVNSGAYSDMGLPHELAEQLNSMNMGSKTPGWKEIAESQIANYYNGNDSNSLPTTSAPKANTSNNTSKTSSRVHYHDFEETVTKEPTCTEPGEKTLTCKIKNELTGKDPCGFTQTAEIPALGHDEGEWITTVEPTCTEPGHRELRCTRCNELLKEEDVPALDHDPGDWETSKEPTCTEEGLKVKKCTRCEEVLEEESIPALGHKPGEWEISKPAGWIHDGEQVRKCTVCGEILETQTIPANHMPLYVIGGIVVLCIGIIAAFIIKKKSRKA